MQTPHTCCYSLGPLWAEAELQTEIENGGKGGKRGPNLWCSQHTQGTLPADRDSRICPPPQTTHPSSENMQRVTQLAACRATREPHSLPSC